MKKCIICGNEMQPYKLKQLVRCSQCDYVCADCQLENRQLAALYDKNFWGGADYTDYAADKEIYKSNFRKRIKELLAFIDNPIEKSVFEIGCAYGFFIEEAIKHFNEVWGIDISEPAIEYAKNSLGKNPKASINFGDYLSFEIDHKFDLICMWDTIEHLQEPGKFVEKAFRDLNSNGIIAITTGDIGSLNAHLRGKKWRQYKPPVHLQYFTKKSLKRLLVQKGFKVLKVSYIWNEMSLNNALYIILCIRSNHKKLYDFLVKRGIKKIKIYINLRDYMFVIARKNGG